MNFFIKTRHFKCLLLLIAISLLLPFNEAHAQRATVDSARLARQHIIDSTRIAQKQALEALRIARMAKLDSIKAARKIISDSLATVRKYRESKGFKDSVANVRKDRLDSIRAVRTAFNDSVRNERQRVIDSTNAVRKAAMEEIRAAQKHRSDSLAAIRKYRNSKRAKDSVSVTRQHRLDSTRLVRKNYTDSVIAARKQILEEAKAIRKKHNDSVVAARKKVTDSLAAMRKVRTDSLAKAKAEREKLQKTNEKLKSDKFNLALELKIKKKRQAWNNEKMLKKKWTIPRRVLQNTVTRYNYYFNAKRKMEEAMANMQRLANDDYDSHIALFPFNPDKDSTKLAPDMDSIIQKASLGIQIHDPRAKWADDLYLLLGRAYYYKGNYEQATTAFRYIISTNQQRKQKELREQGARSKNKDISIIEKDKKSILDFLEHKPANNEALLWLARTYTQMQQPNDAEAILDLMDANKDLPEYQRGMLALEKANLALSKNNFKSASPQLAIVANDKEQPSWLRTRAAYLNGQLLYDQKNYKASAEQFQHVVDMNPKIEMDFYARKYIAYNLMQDGNATEDAVRPLKKMLNDGKYATYYEQVYYVLGRLSTNNKNYDEAINYLSQSVRSKKSTKKQKALSFAGLGDAQYLKGNYRAAGLAYDSAAYLAKYAEGDSLIMIAVARAKVLDKIAKPTELIKEQDSLLALAALSDKEQRNVVRKYLKMLEQQKADSINKAEQTGDSKNNIPETEAVQTPGAYTSWYFTNPVLMQQGFNEFKRKWGSRTNTDNWRRASSSDGLATHNNTNNEDAQEEDGTDEDNGLLNEAKLLAAIPKTAEAQSLARQRIQRAYVDLANAYVNNLKDYEKGTKSLDTLDKRFTAHDHQAEALYIRYTIALKQNNLTLAQSLSEKLRKEYGATKWAQQLAPSDENSQQLAAANGSVANYYDETYGMMMQRDYDNALQRSRNGQKQYSDPRYIKRFQIMEAISLVGLGKYSKADTILINFINGHPQDTLRTWADAILNFSKKYKAVEDSIAKLNSVATIPPAAANALIPTPPITPPETTGKPATQDKAPIQNPLMNATTPPIVNVAAPPISYTYKPKDEHYFLFYFYKAESRAQGVKVGLGDFNTFNYSNQKLKVSLDMIQPTQGVIVVKAFTSAAHARIYVNAVRANAMLLKEYKSDEYQLLTISADNYTKLEAEHDINNYLKFYKANYK